ncbi:amidohydrolase [Absiella sp. AM09-50]|uniref:Amidohydrolase n=2 Tax=Amedibacillus TaxID=2749846 RepID=A0A7G9GTX5_9FIRM|nr:amidohydrolase [[Eubacterium] hominis]RGB56528.1 amidohydrolase [Absiella sp. AM10-20]RGB56890.1 amidohydrolase [Absiella sp. AM22-9]RGB64762.1 amidohydrolase [Absiella sp. AM09-45]RGB73958.1 amidohydrolase [Absiella sp. AM09-50]RGC54068.1 amidohydrolase [Absiella sp. AM29-15]RHU06819.1 amidohydrolase [Absiella sp. AM27-20]
MNVSPAFIEELQSSDEQLAFCRNQMGLYKTDEISIQSMKTLCNVSGIDKLCLLPLDLFQKGNLGTNEQVSELVHKEPELFIAFASVDPHREDALELIETAFTELGLSGLFLHPSQQKFYPDEEWMYPIYELCIQHNKPIIFHSGMSVRPNTVSKYSHPLRFEEVACKYPDLRICLQHFGWPWIREVCMLLLKYKNVYTDTSLLYFDNPKEFYHQSFGIDIGEHWIDRSLRHQVMFASEEPRLEQHRMIEAIRQMNWRESTKKMVLGENAITFLKGGCIHD